MSGVVNLSWNRYRYFPYELELAREEVSALFGAEPISINGQLRVSPDRSERDTSKAADRLTYFAKAKLDDGTVIVPLQTRLEEQSHRLINGNDKLRSRQGTRYSAHGLHEYRGKFNPQIVRAIGNLLNLQSDAWILDPFCGSGTSLLESAHIGWNAIGIDLNPLAVSIANGKVGAFRLQPQVLANHWTELSRRLHWRGTGFELNQPLADEQIEAFAGREWSKKLFNFPFLLRWFSRSVLAQVAVILDEVDRIESPETRLVFRLTLSDVLRRVSYQDTGDLRVRREKNHPETHPVLELYCRETSSKVGNVEAAKLVAGSNGCQFATVADSTSSLNWIRRFAENGVDAVITSPPYATALPYIDTQRLSLALFGLVPATGIATLQKSLIGTREIGETQRRQTERDLLRDLHLLPANVSEFCRRLAATEFSTTDGFRRRNMPALVYQYLISMALCIQNLYSAVRQGGYLAMVVGRNRTNLGGEEILIDTPRMLAEIAESQGWILIIEKELDAYPRFDLHRGNSITTESLVILQKPEPHGPYPKLCLGL